MMRRDTRVLGRGEPSVRLGQQRGDSRRERSTSARSFPCVSAESGGVLRVLAALEGVVERQAVVALIDGLVGGSASGSRR